MTSMVTEKERRGKAAAFQGGGKTVGSIITRPVRRSTSGRRSACPGEPGSPLTPLIHSHVNPHGAFELDMKKGSPLDALVELLIP